MGCSNCGSPAGCGDKGHCATGGCNRLNVFDWLSDITTPSGIAEFNLVEVRFKGSRKEFYRNEDGLELHTGDYVTVESKSGHDVGRVSLKGELVRLQMRKRRVSEDDPEIRKIYRVSNEADLEKLRDARAAEQEILLRSREIIREEGIDMKLSDIEFQGDKTKLYYYYTADERVDFRNLIKVLAAEFKVRVEMRQIGARQEAGLLGGIGVCGRELCCSSWLTDFKSVPTSAARYQNLSLNPMKLAGQCGRLKCCLNFELETYLDALTEFPERADILYTESGRAELVKTDVFKRIMWYTYKDKEENALYPVNVLSVKEILALNAKNEKPESLESMAIKEEVEIEEEDFLDDVTGDLSLNRFDRKKKRNKSKNKNKPRVEGAAPTANAVAERPARPQNDNRNRPQNQGEPQQRNQQPNDNRNRPEGNRNRGDQPRQPRENRPQNAGPRPQEPRNEGNRPTDSRPQQPRNPQQGRPTTERPEGNRPTNEGRTQPNPQANRQAGDARPEGNRQPNEQRNRNQGNRPEGAPNRPANPRPQPQATAGEGGESSAPMSGDQPNNNRRRNDRRRPNRPRPNTPPTNE